MTGEQDVLSGTAALKLLPSTGPSTQQTSYGFCRFSTASAPLQISTPKGNAMAATRPNFKKKPNDEPSRTRPIFVGLIMAFLGDYEKKLR